MPGTIFSDFHLLHAESGRHSKWYRGLLQTPCLGRYRYYPSQARSARTLRGENRDISGIFQESCRDISHFLNVAFTPPLVSGYLLLAWDGYRAVRK